MTVLIVEDDEGKGRQLAELVQEQIPGATVVEKRSYQSGLETAIHEVPELILLDMSIPSFDRNPSEGETGGPPLAYGGRDLIRELSRKRLGSRVIIVTQYDVFGEGQNIMTLDELRMELEKQFRHNYVATVLYRSAQSQWRDELSKALAEVRASL